MPESAISWVTHTMNDQTGCTRDGPECMFCYAERDTWRFAHSDKAPLRYKKGVVSEGQWTGAIYTDLDERRKIYASLRAATKPRRTWHGSMTDLWHENIPLQGEALTVLAEEVARLGECKVPQTLLFLTKRPARLRDWQRHFFPAGLPAGVEVGTTAGTQAGLLRRLPPLLEVAAPVRFLSCEPLLGPLDFLPLEKSIRDGLHLVIVGGESGSQARRMRKEWALSLRDQALTAGCLFHFKQWGSNPGPDGEETNGYPSLEGRIWMDLPLSALEKAEVKARPTR